MMVDAQWHSMSNQLPAERFVAEYGAAPFPAPAAHPERARTTVVQGPVVIIPAGADDKDAAVSLMSWMMSPAIVADVAYETYTLPTSRTAVRDPRFQEIPYFELFVDLMANPNARPANTTPASVAGTVGR
jgi:multiple sugar transport system substrate-binding protein